MHHVTAKKKAKLKYRHMRKKTKIPSINIHIVLNVYLFIFFVLKILGQKNIEDIIMSFLSMCLICMAMQ